FPQYAAQADIHLAEPLHTDQLAAYAGMYSDLRVRSLVTKVEVNEEGGLTLTDAFLGSRNITPVSEHLFVDQLAHKFTGFAIDKEKQSVYMKEPYINPLGHAIK